MKRLHGFVLVRETGKPIPHLVVAAFDSELTQETLARELHELGPRFFAKMGRRLGSVLTDEKGHFELGEANLRGHECDMLPNVLVVVFAPEDAQQIDHPHAIPQERRVLFVTSMPRNAGPEEACVIRLLGAQLERFRIETTSDAVDAPVSPGRYAESVEQAFALNDRVRRTLKPRLEAKGVAATNARCKAKENVGNLSAVRFAHPQHLTDRTKVMEVMKQTITEGISKLPSSRGLSLTLSASELADLGLSIAADGTVSGAVSPLKVAALLAKRNGGVDLVAKRGATAAISRVVDEPGIP